MKPIYLQIADFIIQVDLYQSQSLTTRDKFKKELLAHYKHALVHIPQKRPDCYIVVSDKEVNETYFFPDAKPSLMKVSLPFFEKRNTHRYTTYYYLSITQFHHLLLRILSELITKQSGFLLRCAGTVKNDIVTLSLGAHTKSTISHSVIIRKFGTQFFAYQYPFESSIQSVKKYQILKILFLNKKMGTDTLINLVIPFTNIPQLLKSSFQTPEQKKRVVDSFLLFISFYCIYQP